MTNRALVLAALSQSPSRISGGLHSRDTSLMTAALRQLGTAVHQERDGDWHITPGALTGPAEVDTGLAGTVLRFLPPVAALTGGAVRFSGDAQARHRPVRAGLEALRSLGVRVEGDELPFTVHGGSPPQGGTVSLDASTSSQFISGLLLSGACYRRGLTIVHSGGRLPSRPHIDMTIAMLRRAGARIEEPGDHRWVLRPGPLTAPDTEVEPDLSNAAAFLAAAAATGGEVTIPRWPRTTTQPGAAMVGVLRRMGAECRYACGALSVRGPRRMQGIDVDLRPCGELAPTIAALAALAGSPSRLTGIGHLRGHETNRLHALETEVNKLGGQVRQQEDGLIIRPRRLEGGRWCSYADHRMATAGAIIGLRVRGVEVDDVSSTSKTLPRFPGMWKSMM